MSGSRLCDSYFIQPTMNGVKKYSIAQFGHMDPVSLKKNVDGSRCFDIGLLNPSHLHRHFFIMKEFICFFDLSMAAALSD